MDLYEMVFTFFLIAPLGVTLTVLTINLVVAGLKDLYKTFEERGKKPGTPMPSGPSAQAEVDRYIQELRKGKKLRGMA